MAHENEISKNVEGKYLTFSLGREQYGFGILQVREIIGYMEVTVVPNTPNHVKGVINLRGKVIPVVDLRLKFGMAECEVTERTCIVVLDIVDRNDAGILVGVVVDSVSEVLNIKGEEIEPPPQFGAGVDTPFILGMAKTEKDVKILVDIDRVLGAENIAVLHRNRAAPGDMEPEMRGFADHGAS